MGFGAAAFTRFASEGWWARQDSNLQPDRYERPALTIELQAPPHASRDRQRCRDRLQGRGPAGNAAVGVRGLPLARVIAGLDRLPDGQISCRLMAVPARGNGPSRCAKCVDFQVISE